MEEQEFNPVEMISNLRAILNEERREADALRDSIRRDRATLADALNADEVFPMPPRLIPQD